MPKIYTGVRQGGEAKVFVSTITNGPEAGVGELSITRSLVLCNHSPNGYEWGYSGSGPAQLALAMLLDLGVEEDEAVKHHQTFKVKAISRLPHRGWSLTEEKLRQVFKEISTS